MSRLTAKPGMERTNDLTQELRLMRMSVKLLRSQFVSDLDALLARIDQMLPADNDDARAQEYKARSSADWKRALKRIIED